MRRYIRPFWQAARLSGLSLLEAIVAIAVFGMMASGVMLLVAGPVTGGNSALDRQRALLLAEEGIEAARAIADSRWPDLATGSHGLAVAAGQWAFSGASDTSTDGFTRIVTVEEAYRDAGGDLVLTGGTLDGRTRRVVSEVSWSVLGIDRTVSSVAYVTDWDSYDWKQTTDLEFSGGSFVDTEVVGSGEAASVQLTLVDDKLWSPNEGQLITHTTETDWSGGDFADTETVGTGLAASLSQSGPFRWLETSPGKSFTHTTDADFLPGTFSNTVVVDTGDLGAVTLATYELPPTPAGWSSLASPTASNLNAVDLISASEGWAVGDGGVILRWDGLSWSSVTSPVGNNLYGAYAIASDDVWAVGASGKILHWDGASWSQFQDTGNHNWHDIECPTASYCWISTTSGKFWRWAGSGQFAEVNDLGNHVWAGLSCLSATDCWAAGNKGRIGRAVGVSWSQFQDTGGQTWSGVDMVSPTDGWLVGSGGSIYRWNGSTWLSQASPTGNDLFGVSLASATEGWAVGAAGTVLSWDGVAWSVQASGVTAQLNGVSAVSGSNAQAVGNGGAIITYQTGGGLPETAYYLSGSYLSPVYDAGASADWSRTIWNETLPVGTDLTISFRSGNTAVPDVSWSAWSAEFTDPTGAAIPSPDGRYLQYRASLTTTDATVASRLESLAVYYDEPASFDIHGLRVTDPGIDGWAVGSGGGIARLDGNEWRSYSGSPTTADLYGLDFSADDDVWAVGESGTIIHWNGSAWSLQASPTSEDLYDIDILSDGTGWAVGWKGEIIELRADGQWYTAISPTNKALYAISLHSASAGWAVGANGTALTWNGTAWATATSPTNRVLNGVYSVDSSFAVAVGANGEAHIWNGTAWSASTTGTTNRLNAVWCLSAIDCWAVGDKQTFLAWDGATWSEYYFENRTNPVVNDIHIPASGDGYAGGETGVIYRHTAEFLPIGHYESVALDSATAATVWNTVSWDSSEPIFTSLTVAVRTGETAVPDVSWSAWSSEYTDLGGTTITAPAGRYLQYRITFSTSDETLTALLEEIRIVYGAVTAQDLYDTDGVGVSDVWAVGRAGTIVHYDGASWTADTSPTTNALLGVSALTANDVWAVGTGGTILHYDGAAWTLDPSPPTAQDLNAVFALSAPDVWAVGNSGTIIHYDGLSWSTVSSPTGNDLNGVHFLNSSLGFAVGESGTIVGWGGLAWSSETSPTASRLAAVFVASSAQAWAVGDGGAILTWDGVDWTVVSSPTGVRLHGVEARTIDEAWAVGEFGTILEWDGLAWTSFTSPTARDLYGITVYAPTDGWICGDLGILLKDPPEYPPSGTFISSVLDADSSADFRTAYWQAQYPAGTGVTVAVRSGDTGTPDASWAAWSAEMSVSDGSALTLAAGRYLQYRLTLTTGDPLLTPSLEEITVTYSLQ